MGTRVLKMSVDSQLYPQVPRDWTPPVCVEGSVRVHDKFKGILKPDIRHPIIGASLDLYVSTWMPNVRRTSAHLLGFVRNSSNNTQIVPLLTMVFLRLLVKWMRRLAPSSFNDGWITNQARARMGEDVGLTNFSRCARRPRQRWRWSTHACVQ